MDDTHKKHLLLLYDRPREPVFVAKGDKKTVFEVPNNLLSDRYKPIGVQLQSRFGEDAGENVKVKEIKLPDLSDLKKLSRTENFSLFIPKHRRLATKLIDMFLKAANLEELISMAVYCRDCLNPYLFNYAFTVALLHRPDTQNLDLPSYVHSFPDKFVDSQVFQVAREDAAIVPEGLRTPIEIPKDYTASDLEVEHRIAYWREDIGLNLHHWHWHLVYPFDGPRRIVNKNRRGELFYYMHQQIQARYNFERFSNNLARVKKFNNWQEPIPEAYFPKLDSLVAGRTYAGRVTNQVLQDLNRPADEIVQDVNTMYLWRDRIYDAIHQGFVTTESGQRMELTEFGGIDILGNMVDSSILSPNRPFYGDLHNAGHLTLGYIHDPDHRHLETFGAVGDPTTSMRDPVFFRWHAFVDDLFQEHKATLPRYSVSQLNYPGITVDNIEVKTDGSGGQNNLLNTFWQQSDVDLSRGMDFQPRGSIFVRFTHLQHQEYTYNIKVNNQTKGSKMGTCRIFLAPKFDERGNPWLYRDQKHMFIELDRFTVTLKQGQNTISRHSTNTSITIPFERTFRDVDTNRPTGGDALEAFNYCGCGWPQHLLLPKGTPEGLLCQLFVMISDFNDDKVEQSVEGTCRQADSFCGIKDKLYPDRRSMGYPFDRMPRDGVDTLQQFLTPNMRVQDVIIKFNNRTLRPKSRT